MKLLALWLLLLLPVTLQAKSDSTSQIAKFKATMFARQLTSAANLESLNANLFLNAADQKLFAADIKKNPKAKLPAVTLKDTVVAMNQVKVDFKDIATKVLYVNGTKINVAKYIPYVKSAVMMQDILGRKRAAASLFLSTAEASDFIDYLYAATISSQSALEDLEVPNAALEQTILQTYEKIIDRQAKGGFLLESAFDRAKVRGNDAHYIHLLDFRCESGRLATITDGGGIYNGKLDRRPIYNYLHFDAKTKTYRGSVGITRFVNSDVAPQAAIGRCAFTADESGKITQSRLERVLVGDEEAATCPKVGESIFEIGNTTHTIKNGKQTAINTGMDGNRIINNQSVDLQFGRFPEVADACCQKKGCAEKVKSGVDSMLNAYVDRVQKESGPKASQ